MIRKNIYSRITESIVNAYHDHNLDTAMEDDGSENMGKKIVAIITADPDEDIDWESEYEPFGATELTDADEQEAMEHEGMESDHELCPSCGYDVDCEGDEYEDDEDENDTEAPMIGGGFEDEAEDDYEDMDVKDILVDILQELKGEDSEDSEDEDAFETSDENPMFDGESDESDTEAEDEYEDDDDYDAMLSGDNESDWAADEEASDDEEDYDDEEDFEQPIDDMCQQQEEDEVYTFDALDNA